VLQVIHIRSTDDFFNSLLEDIDLAAGVVR
jgi:hypothetical protein